MQTAPRQVIFILFLVSVAAALWWTWSNFLLPPHTSIVGLAKMGDTFRQCSRGAIDADIVFWNPKVDHVRQVQAALPAMLAGQGAPKLDTLPPGAFFHHQYLGFKQKGVPKILVVIAAYHDVSASRPAGRKPGTVSVDELAHACDEDRSFWTVTYAPRTKKFEFPYASRQ
jgi:hypothetical protein